MLNKVNKIFLTFVLCFLILLLIANILFAQSKEVSLSEKPVSIGKFIPRVKILKELIEKEPDNYSYYLQLASIYWLSSLEEEKNLAIDYAEKAISLDQEKAIANKAYWIIAVASTSLNKPKQGYEYLKKELEVHPGNHEARSLKSKYDFLISKRWNGNLQEKVTREDMFLGDEYYSQLKPTPIEERVPEIKKLKELVEKGSINYGDYLESAMQYSINHPTEEEANLAISYVEKAILLNFKQALSDHAYSTAALLSTDAGKPKQAYEYILKELQANPNNGEAKLFKTMYDNMIKDEWGGNLPERVAYRDLFLQIHRASKKIPSQLVEQ